MALMLIMAFFYVGIMVKPDGVQRRLVGNVISRFEAKGFVLLGLKLTVPTIAMVEEHYEAHKDQPYFKKIVDFMTCGPVVVMVGMLLESTYCECLIVVHNAGVERKGHRKDQSCDARLNQSCELCSWYDTRGLCDRHR